MAQPDESDTDLQKRMGYPYERLASAEAVPYPVFDTRHVRKSHEETIRILTEDNARLYRANAELSRQVAALQASPGFPQVEKPGVHTPPGQSNAALEPASVPSQGDLSHLCPNCHVLLWRDGVCPECDQ
jgi:hypothetical protein